MATDISYITQTKSWIETFIIGMNFCPFAKVPFQKDRIHYVLEESENLEAVGKTLLSAMQYLTNTSAKEVETTLIILPNISSDFLDYLDVVDIAQTLLEAQELEGILQIATFHPQYQFEGTVKGAPENYTNRSPFPMLHLLRESSVSWAVETHADVENIPTQNIARLQALGMEATKKLWNELSSTD